MSPPSEQEKFFYRIQNRHVDNVTGFLNSMGMARHVVIWTPFQACTMSIVAVKVKLHAALSLSLSFYRPITECLGRAFCETYYACTMDSETQH
jgi:hypothetical protein